jgi:cation diffusion facilitator family transporter
MLAVIGALIANALITVIKFFGAFLTGSSGLMAEAFHSLADMNNQIFLLLGLRFYKKPATRKHPFGYGKERFFWSFIAAIFIFGVGATFAIYEGIAKIRAPHQPEYVIWAYGILGVSFILEAVSIGLALYQEMMEARHEKLSFFEYLRESKDPTAKTVIYEDSAALIGIVIAAGGLYLGELGLPPGHGQYWDGIASILIGVILAIVAFSLARSARGLLLGEAATPKSVKAIKDVIKAHPNVEQLVELLTMHLAPKQILVNAHVKLKDDLNTSQVVETIREIEREILKAEPMVYRVFLEAADTKGNI